MPQNITTLNNNTHYLSVCELGIWVWLSWILWLRVFHNTGIMVPASATVISKLSWRRSCSQADVVGRIRFLTGFCSKGLSFSLAVGQRLPSVPCHKSLSLGSSQHGSWLEKGERKRKKKGSFTSNSPSNPLHYETNDLLFIIGTSNNVFYRLYPTREWIRSQI